jgi:phosphoglycolate phosphatase-like HAD superfamily hydrolase
MLRIFTDFDGPIMDVSERYYQVYRYCLEQAREVNQPVTELSKAEFWQLKRAQVPERHIGQLSGLHDDQARHFAQLRRDTVHSLEYLPYDRVFPAAIAALEQLQALGCDLVVMTMRRRYTLDLVLRQEGMDRFFAPDHRYCLADDYVKEPDVLEKPRLMAQAQAQLPPCSQSWMIGDTEADIAAARSQSVPVVGVLSGIRNRERLLAYGPDAIVEDLPQAVATILRQLPTLSASQG